MRVFPPSCVPALTLGVGLLLAPLSFPSDLGRVKLNEAPVDYLKVTLSTDQRVYKKGERIPFTLTMENVGDRPFYVNPSIGIGRCLGWLTLEIRVENGKGKVIPYRGLVACSFIVGDKAAWVEKNCVVLERGQNFTHTGVLSPRSYEGFGKRGRYKLVAIVAFPPLRAGQDEAAAVRYPVWVGRAQSEPVWIEIAK